LPIEVEEIEEDDLIYLEDENEKKSDSHLGQSLKKSVRWKFSKSVSSSSKAAASRRNSLQHKRTTF